MVAILPVADKIWWQTIWDDINSDIESVPVTPITYDVGSLTNRLYTIIDNKNELRHVLLNNTVVGLYKHLQSIQSHCALINTNKELQRLVSDIFAPNVELSSLDVVFINSYYRRVLRARLEVDYITKHISAQTVITGNKDNDKYIVQALRLFQVICRYLGIKSTTTANSFDSSKLDNDIFWSPISEKLLIIFGENRIALINEHERDWLVKPNITRQLQQQEITRSQTFILLNIVFNGWSGSILTIEKNNSNIINIIPATYITRMMMKLI